MFEIGGDLVLIIFYTHPAIHQKSPLIFSTY